MVTESAEDSTGTLIRKKYGLAGASAFLGHSDLEISETYCERNIELGMKIAVEEG